MERTNQEMGTIPGPFGYPVVGNLPQLLPNPLPYLLRLRARFGDLFYVGFAGNRRSVMLLSPEATQLALVDRADAFSAELGYLEQGRFIGERAVLFRDGTSHRVLRRAMNPAFRATALDGYLDAMTTRIDRQVEAWSEGTPDLASDIRLMSLEIAAEVIAGTGLDGTAPLVHRHFTRMLDGMVSVLPPWPGTAAAKAAVSRNVLDRHFRGQIDHRRASTQRDLFTSICRDARSEQGHALSDDEVTDNMLGLLVASYETTASAILSMAYRLANEPGWQDRMRDELIDGGHAHSFDRKSLEDLQVMDWVLKETLRLDPPLPYLPRRTNQEVEVGEHVLPAQTAVTLAPAFLHRMASLYPDPERFDPLRFSPERAEDRAHPCAFMPFGKGPHTCMGMHFARLEIKAFFTRLLSTMELAPTKGGPPTMRYVPVHGPAGRIPVTVRPRT